MHWFWRLPLVMMVASTIGKLPVAPLLLTMYRPSVGSGEAFTQVLLGVRFALRFVVGGDQGVHEYFACVVSRNKRFPASLP